MCYGRMLLCRVLLVQERYYVWPVGSQTFTQVFAADGTLRTVEIAGPPDINVWSSSFDVFATGAIMLDILDLGVILKYRKMIHRYHTRYGSQVKCYNTIVPYMGYWKQFRVLKFFIGFTIVYSD